MQAITHTSLSHMEQLKTHCHIFTEEPLKTGQCWVEHRWRDIYYGKLWSTDQHVVFCINELSAFTLIGKDCIYSSDHCRLQIMNSANSPRTVYLGHLISSIENKCLRTQKHPRIHVFENTHILLHKTVHYNIVLDKTWFKAGSQNN